MNQRPNQNVRRCETCQYSQAFQYNYRTQLLAICSLPLFRETNSTRILLVGKTDGTQCAYYKANAMEVTKALNLGAL